MLSVVFKNVFTVIQNAVVQGYAPKIGQFVIKVPPPKIYANLLVFNH